MFALFNSVLWVAVAIFYDMVSDNRDFLIASIIISQLWFIKAMDK